MKRDVPEGALVTIEPGTDGNLAAHGVGANVMVTFDGGYRSVQGRMVAAGAAIVWQKESATCPWERVLTKTRCFPVGESSGAAEAWACRGALECLDLPRSPVGAALVSNDNISLVKYAAGTA
eukprot:10971871-Lingulodinium_polyedra.AAC.1